MSVIARWFGNGLAGGTAVSTSTAGPGDDALDAVTSGTFTIHASGLRSPRIRMSQQAATVAQMVWDTTTLGSRTAYAVRAYVELSANPSAGAPLITAYGTNNTAQRWRVDVKADGTLRLRDAANTELQVSPTALPLPTVVRIEVVVNGTTATTYAYTGESTTALFTPLTGAVGSGMDAIRWGNPQTAPTWPTLDWDDLAVSDTAALIGPRVRRATAAWTASVDMTGTGQAVQHPTLDLDAEVTWDANPHAARHASGTFAAEALMSATPKARRRASAAWTLEAGLTIDTGDPAVSALSGGAWRPATIRQMTGGTWQPA